MHFAMDAPQKDGRIGAGAGTPGKKDQTHQVRRRHAPLGLRPKVDRHREPQPHAGLPLPQLPPKTMDGKE